MNRIISIIVGVLVLALLGVWVTGYMPGTIRRDSNGFIHGTGLWRYRYDSGALKLEEHYFAGQLTLSRWFHRDGTLIAETRWDHGDGVGYFLRDDGTVRVKMEFQNGKAHGKAIYYKEDGVTVDHVAEYEKGHEIDSKN